MVSTLGAARVVPGPAARRRAPHQHRQGKQLTLLPRHARPQQQPPVLLLRGHRSSSSDAVRAHASSSPSSSSSDWLVPDALVRALDPLRDAESAPPSTSTPPAAAAPSEKEPDPNDANPNDDDANLTVYTLRLTTPAARNAGASDPASSVQVLLLGRDGRAVLRRVAPVYDPSDAERTARHICDVVGGGGGEGVGADCSRFLDEGTQEQRRSPPPATAATTTTTTPRPAPPGPVRARFQPGAVDEVSFLAPDLGHPLAAMIVAPESGTWSLDEATVNSSRTGRGDRFVCRRLVGSGAPGAARAAERRSRGGGNGGGPGPGPSAGPAYLTPVPAGAVVVGEGAAQKALTRAEADALRERGMQGYSRLKAAVTAATALSAAVGSVLAGSVGGPEAAAPFALGGAAGLGYWALLQLGVAAALPAAGAAAGVVRAGAEEGDGAGGGGGGGGVGADAPPRAPAAARPEGSPLIRFLGSAPFRVAAVGAVAVVAASAARWSAPQPEAAATGGGGGGNGSARPAVSAHASLRPWQLGLAAAGFLTYKVAIVGVGALGLGEDGEDGGEGGGGGGGGRGKAGGAGSGRRQPAAAAALSARDLEATRAMRAPSPTSRESAGEGDDEDADD